MGIFSSARKHKGRYGSTILLLMMFAFALKAVLPAGFMPDHKNGLMALVICSGMGEKTIFVPEDQGSPASQDHQDDKSAKPLCAYQALASGKSLIPVPAIALVQMAIPAAHDLPEDVERPLSTLSSIFQARGPPRA